MVAREQFRLHLAAQPGSHGSMKRPKRERIRPIKNTALADKRFTPALPVKKRINVKKIVHPLTVIADLRRGSISSLDRYLSKTKGMIDREVAVELRKLISGSIQRTKYRLIVVEHPQAPKDMGGRPKGRRSKPSDDAFKVADEFAALRQPGQVKLAIADVAKNHKISPSTVYAHTKSVAEYRNTKLREKAGERELALGPSKHGWNQDLDARNLQLRRDAARKATKTRLKNESD
jgi:hypothetical protein